MSAFALPKKPLALLMLGKSLKRSREKAIANQAVTIMTVPEITLDRTAALM